MTSVGSNGGVGGFGDGGEDSGCVGRNGCVLVVAASESSEEWPSSMPLRVKDGSGES